MSADPRPTSSIYSDTFELEDLIQRLSVQVREQDLYAELREENERLQLELFDVKARWRQVKQILDVCILVDGELIKLYQDAVAKLNKRRNIWFANCTAF